ncbi:aminoacyl--tRNA ligase-related protein [Bradyrhizobium sp. SBR1B]|uniref:aminoacyl--tRNA ligase-related protein n=1 Tax=Bradyrhizobium sp. SBR1B TaxID=2663836 RepID=UPI0016059EBF|nr:aminoacyl--tRNA ligase-related protein [Bradyrhizobium sp. SBR1B]MBB4379983.1 prolyl-tRNA synthetase [Bradyrhizobium sp. SBR1B]
MPQPMTQRTSPPPEDSRAITPRSVNFSEWFQETVSAGAIVRYSDVPGCFIFGPNGAELWDRVRFELDTIIKATGHKTVMYPTLIPESLLKREADHIEGFAPELARVTSLHGQQLPDPLVLRPTSEAVIYNDWRKMIRSEADLPVIINQWCNVFRVERRTRPLLRTFEFFWQEGHTAHATDKEAREETLKMLHEYARFMRDTLAIPVIVGRKTKSKNSQAPERRIP